MYKRKRRGQGGYLPKRTRYAYGTTRTGGNYSQILRRRLPLTYRRGGRWTTGPGPERKFIDSNGSCSPATLAIGASSAGDSGTPTNPNSYFLINGISQGTDATTRIGRKIKMKSLQIRWTVSTQLPATGLNPAGLVAGDVRVLVVYDRQCNGVLPAVTDILQSGTVSCVTSPMNLNNRERFIVLVDKFFHLDPQGPGSHVFRCYRKIPASAQDVIFNAGNAGTIADIVTGAVIVVTATTVQATVAGAIDGNMYTRIRFLDD